MHSHSQGIFTDQKATFHQKKKQKQGIINGAEYVATFLFAC